MKKVRWPLLPLLALVTSCGGGTAGGSDASAAVAVVTAPPAAAIATPAPTPTASPATPTPTPAVAAGTDFASSAAALYASPPSIAGCQPGQLSPAVTAALLASLNNIRALHKLPPVTYSSSDEAAAQAAALLQAANDTLSHSPPTTWKCFTTLGATGSGASDLYGGFGNGLTVASDDDILAGWLKETNNLIVDSVGHRRWLLDPFLGSVAYGRVVGASPTQTRADAAALKVFNNVGSHIATGALPAYVAYPFGDYPARYFTAGALLSFSAIASSNPNSAANAQVSYASAVVTVRVRGGAALAVSKQSFDNEGYGLPNNLQFAVAGLQAGTYYDVAITGVVVNGAVQSYSYSFRIV